MTPFQVGTNRAQFLFDGNSNNRVHYGAFYCNLNNTVSNANWYLQDLDHFIKEDLDASHYMRYMDDMVVFGSDKAELHRMKDRINSFLQDHLGLELKDNWQVFLDKTVC